MAFLCDDAQKDLRSINDRIRGVQSVIDESGHPDANLNLLWSPTHRSRDFARVVRDRLEQQDPPTVILCAGDLTAIELMVGLRPLGYDVPGDICITGYDDLLTPYIAANLHLDGEALPWNLPLTTVRQPLSRIGATAAQLLVEQIEGKFDGDRLEHLLDVELVTGLTSIPASPRPAKL